LPRTPERSEKSFEEAFAALQEVVRQLESGTLSLEASLELVDRGTRLSETCQSLLTQAELRVTRLPAESASSLSDLPAES